MPILVRISWKSLDSKEFVYLSIKAHLTMVSISTHLLFNIRYFKQQKISFINSMKNYFRNYAVDRDGRSTIVAGTPGQQYVDNVFFNPDNDYEMLTMNRSQYA